MHGTHLLRQTGSTLRARSLSRAVRAVKEQLSCLRVLFTLALMLRHLCGV
jgi:hypothetical protein